MRFLFLVILLAGFSIPAKAQQEAQANAGINIKESVRKGQDDYVARLTQLTQTQRDELHDLDKEFSVTLQPTLDAYDMGGKLIFCLQAKSEISRKQKHYVEVFKIYQAERAQEQEEMWKEHRQRATQIDYIDHVLIDHHYAFIQALQTGLTLQLVDKNGKAGAYNGIDCKEVQKDLDGSADRAKKAFSGTFDGKQGTLGVPAE